MKTSTLVLRAIILAVFLSTAAVWFPGTLLAQSQTGFGAKQAFGLGLKLLKTRQYKDAIEQFSAALSAGTLSDNLPALVYYHRGLAFQALGQFDKARKDYSQAIKLKTLKDSVLKVAYYNRGIIHDALKRPNAALADFTSAINKNPEFAPAYHNLGNVLRKMGRNERAIKNFLKSLELGNPQPQLPYMGLALAYEAIGRKPEAITSLKYALRVRPKFKKAQAMLARLTTQDLYSFPNNTSSSQDTTPTVTASISKNVTKYDIPDNSRPLLTEFDRLDQRLGNLVKRQPEAVKYKKLALRGSMANASSGSVALVVPGPGFTKAIRSTPAKKSPARRPPKGLYYAQLATSETDEKAEKIWFFLRAQHDDLLKNLKPNYERVKLPKQKVFYRIQAGPFNNRQAINKLCQAINKRGVNCFPVYNKK